MTNLLLKIRYLINDISTLETDIFTYGSSKTFTLSESNVISIDDVYVNDVSSAVTYTYNSTSKKVTITSSLVSGDVVQADFNVYSNYSDTELTVYTQAALIHIGINNYKNFEYDATSDAIYPTPETNEENLIATITSILIAPDNRSIRLPDITINSPSDVPTNRKISQTISIFKKNTHGVFSIV